MRSGFQGFSGPYQRWAEAQDAVSAYEKQVFDSKHQLTALELENLQTLRKAAAEQLCILIQDVDNQLSQLRGAGLTFGATAPVPSDIAAGPNIAAGVELAGAQTLRPSG